MQGLGSHPVLGTAQAIGPTYDGFNPFRPRRAGEGKLVECRAEGPGYWAEWLLCKNSHPTSPPACIYYRKQTAAI